MIPRQSFTRQTHYDILKNDWELENFSGIRPEVIAQEHQATVVISNMAALIEHEAQIRWEERRAGQSAPQICEL